MSRQSLSRIPTLLCLCAVILGAGAVRVAASAAQPAEVCEWAAQQAAAESGVPADILGALTLTETGRRLDGVVRPWAWSVNSEGAGSWYDDPTEALAFARDRIAQGRRNLDVGCFQINVRWHGENFRDVSQMFDPLENARYAARFLQDLYRETGDWRAAAGAFHSRTPRYANRYLARFDTLRSALQDRGFGGMTGTPETYNSFASANHAAMPAPDQTAPDRTGLDPMTALAADLRVAAGLPPAMVVADAAPKRRVRQAVLMMGAAVGTPVSGRAGSLAVIGGGGAPLLGDRAAAPASLLPP